MRRTLTALLCTAAVPLLLAACGTGAGDGDGDGDGDRTSASATNGTTTSPEPASVSPTADAPSDAPTEAPTTAPAETPTDRDPAFPEDTSLQFAESSGEWDLVLTDVRVGEHDGFDRVVLEFTGAGVPGWSVGWVDEARLEGSGEAVSLDGDAVLDIYASGTTWPADGYYDGPRQFEPADGGDVADVYVGGTFEGYTQVLAGIDDARTPFRVFALSDPPRLVVDVADTAD